MTIQDLAMIWTLAMMNLGAAKDALPWSKLNRDRRRAERDLKASLEVLRRDVPLSLS